MLPNTINPRKNSKSFGRESPFFVLLYSAQKPSFLVQQNFEKILQVPARLQSGYIQDNTKLTTRNYEISEKCLSKEQNTAHPSQMAGEESAFSAWLAGSPLFTYAKYSDLLNILLRALQRSFRRLEILLCVPSDLWNDSRMNSSCSSKLTHVAQSQQ